MIGRMERVDLHCHSLVSDGLLAPAEVVERAAAHGVGVLALTDHDDVGGLAEARAAAQRLGLRFVDGVEISTTWEDTTVHILGLGIDPADARLREGLERLRAGRAQRAEAMAAALGRCGYAGALEGAMRHAGDARILGRTHFARFLVERGAARDVRSVFDHYLVRGKPGHVPHHWAEVAEAVGWITGAGGVAAIAHPARYRVGRAALRRLIEQFRACGGTAMEVVSSAHTAEDTREFARLAAAYGLLGSCGSDFHAPGESQAELGETQALPEGVEPLWPRLL